MDFLPVYIASLMIVLVLAILSYVAYMGYDVRSRGFNDRGNVLMTFYVNGITLKSYFQRRDSHPVVNEAHASRAKVYLVGCLILAVLFVALLIVVIIHYV